MPAIKYKVELTPSQRSDLIEVSRRGKPLARTVKRALALLKADEGLSDREAAEAVSVSALTVARARRRFVDEGLEAAINDRPRPGRERKLSGRQEAVGRSRGSPPRIQYGAGSGCHRVQQSARRTCKLDAPSAGGPGGGAGVCREHLLGDGAPDTQKNELKPWKKKEWCIPKVSGEFVARMEDVLDLYHEEYDPERPVVCFDETSKQLLGDVRPPIEAAPGRMGRYDTEYQRNGTRNLFMFCEPKGGWRRVEVTVRRTAVDFAHRMKWLVDQAYPDATVVRLVLDNLNTHKLGSLYEAFAPSEARRIAKRLEFHHTPVHGSWLNMAEIELSVFSRQCLNRRIGDEALLRREVAALERERNEAAAIIDWRFSTHDARSKLKHVYPS